MGRKELKQSENPLVSIIIPTFNSRTYLDQAVNCALNQTYQNIEVILVDDGSTDGTISEFKRYEKSGVTCIYQENAGASSARNCGLEVSHGEFIQFLDADDVLHAEKIEKQIAAMIEKNATLSFTPFILFFEDVHESNEFIYDHVDYSKERTGQELMASLGTEGWGIPTVAWLINKAIIEKAGYWNPAKCPNDDGEFFSRVLFWSKKVICVDEKLAYYRSGLSDSLSELNSEDKALSSLKSWQLIRALLATSSEPNIMMYPKRGYLVIYFKCFIKFPKIAKLIAREFDEIEADNYYRKNKVYTFFINNFGLHLGQQIYRQFSYLKSITRR